MVNRFWAKNNRSPAISLKVFVKQINRRQSKWLKLVNRPSLPRLSLKDMSETNCLNQKLRL
jgi:hypothetical protein